MRVCILGCGSWGTAQALLLHNNGHEIYLWGRPEDGINDLTGEQENKRFLPGVILPREQFICTSEMFAALAGAEAVVLAVPSQAVREVLNLAAEFLPSAAYIVNTAKGLEISTYMRMSQVVSDVLGSEAKERYIVLSGPSHAEEVAQRSPTAVTVAADKIKAANQIQDLYMNTWFRVYTNPDMAGVELGGALKNIIALAAGMVQGLGYGDNTKAALITRGLIEIVRMGIALGADRQTFSGLSGLGDLIVTCGSRHSRNRKAGEMLGQGISLSEVLELVGMVVEGVHTTQAVYRLARELGIDMPITCTCYDLLYKNADPHEAVKNIMQRPKKNEIEIII